MIKRLFLAAALVAASLSAAAQPSPGPGPTPQPWTVNGPTISYNKGAVVVGSPTGGGSCGVGCVNLSGSLRINNVPLLSVSAVDPSLTLNSGTLGINLANANVFTVPQTAPSLVASGTAGAGFFQAANQTSTPSTPSSAGRLYFDSGNRFSWIGTNGFTASFDATGNSASRSYVLPNAATTLVGRDTTDTLTNKSLSGAANTFTNIPAGALTGLVSTTVGGLGIDASASTGVPLFSAGTVAMTSTMGTGSFARADGSTFTNGVFGGEAAITSGRITGMSSPIVANEVATKDYVDVTAAGLNPLPASFVATAAALPNTPVYNNGAAGVGATLTAGANTTLTVDGIVVPLNGIVLVKDQSSAFQNGQFYLSTAGSGVTPWVLTRCTLAACGKQYNTAATLLIGSRTFVTFGIENANKSFVQSSNVTTVGTDAVTYFLYTQPVTGPVNVLSFGAIGDGVTDDLPAIQAAVDTGLTVYAPRTSACYRISSDLVFNTRGQRFFGDGQDVGRTQFCIKIADAASFINGGFAFASGEQGPTIENIAIVHEQSAATATFTGTMVGTSLTTSGVTGTLNVGDIVYGYGFASGVTASEVLADLGLGNYTMSVSQSIGPIPMYASNSCDVTGSPIYANAVANRSLLTTYKPAIYAVGTPRFQLYHVQVEAATDVLDARGNTGGFRIFDLFASAFNTGILVDGSLDTQRADWFHFWNVGMSQDQVCIFQSPGTIALDAGRTDGLYLNEFLNISYLGLNIHTTGSGPPVVYVTNFGFDSNSGVTQSGGSLQMTNGYMTMRADQSVFAFEQTGGWAQLSNLWVLMGPATIPIRQHTNPSHLQVNNAYITQGAVDVQAYQMGVNAGARAIWTNIKMDINLAATFTNPLIDILGSNNRFTLSTFRTNDTLVPTNVSVSTATDDIHNITSISTPGFLCSHPPKVSAIWANNTGATCN